MPCGRKASTIPGHEGKHHAVGRRVGQAVGVRWPRRGSDRPEGGAHHAADAPDDHHESATRAAAACPRRAPWTSSTEPITPPRPARIPAPMAVNVVAKSTTPTLTPSRRSMPPSSTPARIDHARRVQVRNSDRATPMATPIGHQRQAIGPIGLDDRMPGSGRSANPAAELVHLRTIAHISRSAMTIASQTIITMVCRHPGPDQSEDRHLHQQPGQRRDGEADHQRDDEERR